MARKTKNGNGEGGIRERADGTWEARISLDGGKRKSLYGKTRHEVASKLAAATRDRNKGLPIAQDERQTVAAFLTGWLDRVKSTIRPRTHRRYGELLAHVIASLGRVPLGKLTPMQVERFYTQLLDDGLSCTTVHHLHTVLHHALHDALRKGAAARNVCDLVDPPRIRRHEPAVLTPEQVRALLATAKGDRLEALYVLALSTGMRSGELLGLKWRDVDVDAATLHVRGTLQVGKGLVISDPKTDSSRRSIVLTSVAVDALRAHRTRQLGERLAMGSAWEDTGLVFVNTIGGKLEATNLLRREFRPLLRRAGLPDAMRFHDLRHTAATLLMGRDMNSKKVSALLGHASSAITQDIYSHFQPDMQREVAAVMDAILRG